MARKRGFIVGIPFHARQPRVHRCRELAQYRFIVGSTSSAHASTPPARLCTCVNPGSGEQHRRMLAPRRRDGRPARAGDRAAARRMRRAISPSGIDSEPSIRHSSNSHGSRTSTTSGASRDASARQRASSTAEQLRNQNSKCAGDCGVRQRREHGLEQGALVDSAPGATQRTSRAAITGASPTTANTRPPGFSCSHECARAAPASIRSARSHRRCALPQPRAPSPTASSTLPHAGPRELAPASAASAGSISTLVTRAPMPASSAAKYPLPVPISSTLSPDCDLQLLQHARLHLRRPHRWHRTATGSRGRRTRAGDTPAGTNSSRRTTNSRSRTFWSSTSHVRICCSTMLKRACSMFMPMTDVSAMWIRHARERHYRTPLRRDAPRRRRAGGVRATRTLRGS